MKTSLLHRSLVLSLVLVLPVGCDSSEGTSSKPAQDAPGESVVAKACPEFGEELCKRTDMTCERAASMMKELTFTPTDCAALTKTVATMAADSDRAGSLETAALELAWAKATNITDAERKEYEELKKQMEEERFVGFMNEPEEK